MEWHQHRWNGISTDGMASAPMEWHQHRLVWHQLCYIQNSALSYQYCSPIYKRLKPMCEIAPVIFVHGFVTHVVMCDRSSGVRFHQRPESAKRLLGIPKDIKIKNEVSRDLNLHSIIPGISCAYRQPIACVIYAVMTLTMRQNEDTGLCRCGVI